MTSADESPSPDPTTVEATEPPEEREDGVDVEDDTQSDPAMNDSKSSEWAGEGGATDEGPATDA
jgi:hypothetical protein